MEFNIGLLDGLIMIINNLPEDELITETGDNINFNFTFGENNSEGLRVRAFGLPFLLENPAIIDLPNSFTPGPIEGFFFLGYCRGTRLFKSIHYCFSNRRDCG